MKKLTSIFLAMAMIFALAIPALANGPQQQTPQASSNLEHEFNYEGGRVTMEIAITLPDADNAKIMLNPYKMEYANTNNIYVDKLAAQVFSIPSVVKSESNVALKVGMTITGDPKGDITLVDTKAAAEAQSADKNVWLEMQYGLTTAANTPPTADTVKKVTVTDEVILDGTTGKEFVTMPIASQTAPAYFSIVFTGAANTDPEESYKETDKVGVNIAYTFIPVPSEIEQLQANEEYDPTANEGDGNDIVVTLPTALTLKASGTTTYTSPKYKATAEATSLTDGITLTTRGDYAGKQFTIKKEAISKNYVDEEQDAKYVVLIPVEFTTEVETKAAADNGGMADYGSVTYRYNVRLVMNPTPAQNTQNP